MKEEEEEVMRRRQGKGIEIQNSGIRRTSMKTESPGRRKIWMARGGQRGGEDESEGKEQTS